MRPESFEFLANACGARLTGCPGLTVSDVKIDSREAKAGDLFVAVKGPNNDGHRYMESAYAQGCRCFLVSDGDAANALVKAHPDACCALTDDTQYAFELMAKGYIDRFDLIKIAVTGSTGKTSTKALTAAVMSAKYRTVCSRKNYNTHLGIAMTCFLADETTECLVLEMGMDRHNELHDYCEWARPDAALITNVGVVHMEYIGSREGIAIEKLKVADFFDGSQPLVCNCDSPFLSREEIARLSSGKFRLVMAGEGPEAEIKISDITGGGLEGTGFTLSCGEVSQRFELPFPGKHNAHNGALAAAMGLQFGISLEKAAKAMPKADLEGKRLEICRLAGAVLVDSSYNANPDSMASAIRTLADIPAERKIAVVADMRELGDATEESHVEIGRLASELGIDTMLAIGPNRAYYAEGTRLGPNPVTFMSFEKAEDAESTVRALLKPGAAMLIKGSLSTNVHCLAEKIRAEFE